MTARVCPARHAASASRTPRACPVGAGQTVVDLGLFVFVAVIPSIFLGSFTLARLAIVAWMMLWAALAGASWRSPDTRASPRDGS